MDPLDSYHPEQAYIFEHADRLGIPLNTVVHTVPTTTCNEKADLLGWDADQVIKASFLAHKRKPGYLGIITPELGDHFVAKKHKEYLRDLLGDDLLIDGKPLSIRGYQQRSTPKGMIRGTCTPFPLASVLEQDIDRMIFRDHHEEHRVDPADNAYSSVDHLVDISIGGGEDKKLISLQLPYWGIYEILKAQAPDKVKIYKY